MSSYTEIDTALLDLDFTNPRIQNYLQNYPEETDQENYLLCC